MYVDTVVHRKKNKTVDKIGENIEKRSNIPSAQG